MLKFIDEKVMKDYDGFVQVAIQYEKDADSVNDIVFQYSLSSTDRPIPLWLPSSISRNATSMGVLFAVSADWPQRDWKSPEA